MGSLQKYTIKEGQFTFGQRIHLGKIVTSKKLTETEMFKQAIQCLHPGYEVKFTRDEMVYWLEILEGIEWWIAREKKELDYKPTAEEYAAGIEALSLKVGEMTTISALAEKFSKDPDDVLQWKYGKVFNLLVTNLQSFLYRERLKKIYQAKSEREAEARRRSKRK